MIHLLFHGFNRARNGNPVAFTAFIQHAEHVQDDALQVPRAARPARVGHDDEAARSLNKL